MQRQSQLLFVAFCLAYPIIALAQADAPLHWTSLFGTSKINGKNVQIESAQSPKSPRDELDRVKSVWKSAGSHVITDSKDGWQLVSRIHHGQLEIIQAKPLATGTSLMRHRVSVESPAQSAEIPEWIRAEGRVLFETQTGDAFQSGSSWLVELSGQDDGSQIIQRITERARLHGYQPHPNFAVGQQFSSVRSNYGKATQTVLSAEGGRQLLLQIVPNKSHAMLLVTQVHSRKSTERVQ
jgi:hypothetical protein